MSADKSDVLPGTLEMLTLKTLSLGPLHGYGIAQHIKRLSRDVLQIEEGSLYPALQRMQVKGWVGVRVASHADQTARALLPTHGARPEATRRRGVRASRASSKPSGASCAPRRREMTSAMRALARAVAQAAVDVAPRRRGAATSTTRCSFHRELLARDFEANGLSPRDAHDAARRQFGNPLMLARTRAPMNGAFPSVEDIAYDVRFAIRMLRRSPGVRSHCHRGHRAGNRHQQRDSSRSSMRSSGGRFRWLGTRGRCEARAEIRGRRRDDRHVVPRMSSAIARHSRTLADVMPYARCVPIAFRASASSRATAATPACISGNYFASLGGSAAVGTSAHARGRSRRRAAGNRDQRRGSGRESSRARRTSSVATSSSMERTRRWQA